MERRTVLDIYYDILVSARAGARRTHISNRANLNYKHAKGHIATLMEYDMLEQDGSIFVTTEKGQTFIENFDSVVAPLMAG